MSVLVGLLSLSAGRGQEIRLTIAPPPNWLTPVVLQTPTWEGNRVPAQDTRWLLRERQINAQNNETYAHEILQILSPSAAAKTQGVSIDADIGCQTLTFHWARIWRNTNSYNQLAPERVVASSNRAGRATFLFSGKIGAELLLQDVRPGDLIDYAYTVSGSNPALGGRFAENIELETSQADERFVTHLLWPSSRRFYIQNHGTDVKPLSSALGKMAEYKWDLKKIPALAIEPPLPSWYTPFPWVELSEFQHWADVNQWALGMFTNGPLSADLKQQIAEWKQLPAGQAQALAALNFVEDEIRSTDNEGPAKYKLTDPSAVFESRGGDEKEKNFLFVTILRMLGIEAYPVLVNTRFRETLAPMHPSPALFDRLITQVVLDGQSYWLDAADSAAHGSLSVRTWPDYGCGLVVRSGTATLTAIPLSAAPSQTTVSHFIVLGGYADPASWRVVTLAEGSDAERLRIQYATVSHEDLSRQHLAYYAKFYPEVTQTRPMIYADEETQNRVEVTEFYSVPKMWVELPNEPYFSCQVEAFNMEMAMAKPSIEDRTMPLGLPYPEHHIYHAEVTVQSIALINPVNETINDPAFVFHRSVAVSGSSVALDYDYRALTQEVMPEAMPSYLRQLSAALDTLRYKISSY
jgi:transglutaminase-like putative cysteine protease